MGMNDNGNIIEELLTRSISEVFPSKQKLRDKLKKGEKVRIYIGADATGTALHLGHATNFMILERFRQLGHKTFILIGDFTAMIGDPTDKLAARKQLTRDEVKKNSEHWLEQLKPIINIHDKNNPVSVVYNSDWFSNMSAQNVINLTSHFTIQQILKRDMFEKRIEEGKDIYIHEFLYPMMQGFDSVELDVDIELCGNDQLFNALAGRALLKDFKNKEKFIITTTLLQNPITKEKMMSKSLGTGVYLNESADSMYSKLLMQPVENVPQLLTDCTYLSLEEISRFVNAMKENVISEREAKEFMAKKIVKIYHN
jgi:tyrosyl-tRNA synthetase